MRVIEKNAKSRNLVKAETKHENKHFSFSITILLRPWIYRRSTNILKQTREKEKKEKKRINCSRSHSIAAIEASITGRTLGRGRRAGRGPLGRQSVSQVPFPPSTTTSNKCLSSITKEWEERGILVEAEKWRREGRKCEKLGRAERRL